jgi:hypothetical protein
LDKILFLVYSKYSKIFKHYVEVLPIKQHMIKCFQSAKGPCKFASCIYCSQMAAPWLVGLVLFGLVLVGFGIVDLVLVGFGIVDLVLVVLVLIGLGTSN